MVVLGYVHDGDVRAEFMRSVLAVKGDPLLDDVIDDTAGSLIGKARNLLVTRFMSMGFDWLWMVDTDVVFSAGALRELVRVADAVERPLVSGVVPVVRPDGSTVPSVWKFGSNERGLTIEPVEDLPPGDLVEVGAVGAACLLIHRSVFAKVAAEVGAMWFSPLTINGAMVGDDIAFCMRAGHAGVTPTVVPAVRAGHVKPVVFGSIAP